MDPIQDINSIVFTSALSDVTFTTESEVVEVALACYGALAFTTSLCAHNGRVTLYDLRSIVEPSLISNRQSCVDVTLTVKGDAGDEFEKDFFVVYQRKICRGSAVEWLRTHFLTTLDARRTYSTVAEQISYFASADEDITTHYKITLRYGDEYRVISYSSAEKTQGQDGVNSIDVGYNDIKGLLTPDVVRAVPDIEDPLDYDEVVAWSVRVGERVANFYLNDSTPDISFAFRNSFYVWEYAHLCATTIKKNEVTQSESFVGSITRIYDRKIEVSREVTTSPLTIAEAYWMEDLTQSDDVRLAMEAGAFDDIPEVIVTESSVSVSDDDTLVNSVKFTWRYADDRDYLPNEQPTEDIFSKEFDYAFK